MFPITSIFKSVTLVSLMSGQPVTNALNLGSRRDHGDHNRSNQNLNHARGNPDRNTNGSQEESDSESGDIVIEYHPLSGGPPAGTGHQLGHNNPVTTVQNLSESGLLPSYDQCFCQVAQYLGIFLGTGCCVAVFGPPAIYLGLLRCHFYPAAKAFWDMYWDLIQLLFITGNGGSGESHGQPHISFLRTTSLTPLTTSSTVIPLPTESLMTTITTTPPTSTTMLNFTTSSPLVILTTSPANLDHLVTSTTFLPRQPHWGSDSLYTLNGAFTMLKFAVYALIAVSAVVFGCAACCNRVGNWINRRFNRGNGNGGNSGGS